MVRAIEEVLKTENLRVIGKGHKEGVYVRDAIPKATGSAKFAGDQRPDRLGSPAAPKYAFGGMLHVKLLRSTHTHARIKRVDTAAAEALDGVVAILTPADAVPMAGYPGKTLPAKDKAHFYGDVIAAVAALDELTAQNATELIEVEYESLPFVLDGEKAMHPEEFVYSPAEIARYPGGARFVEQQFPLDEPTYEIEFGDLDGTFTQADKIVERRYKTQKMCSAFMEPHTYVAKWDGRNLTLWMSVQSPFPKRADIAESLGLPEEEVRIIAPYLGTGYGTRDNGEYPALIVALLAKKAGRPCRLEFTRWETNVCGGGRAIGIYDFKAGLSQDGKVIALDAKTNWNQGEHASNFTLISGGAVSVSRFTPWAARWRGYQVYSNVINVYKRGYGSTEHNMAYEVFMDELAVEVGMDPVEFRLKNHHQFHVKPEQGLPGAPLTQEVLEAAIEAIGWKDKWQSPEQKMGIVRRGLGIAVHDTHAIPNPTESLIRIEQDGTIRALPGEGNMGTSNFTVVAKVVAEVLEVDYEDVEVSWGDTEGHSNTWQNVGSLSARSHGAAFLKAAVTMREKLIEHASQILGVGPDEFDFVPGQGMVRVLSTGQVLTFAEIAGQAGGLEVREFLDTGDHEEWEPHYAIVAAAEVEVDLGTGQVTPIEIVCAANLGKAINPTVVEGQLEGGMIYGIRYALFEDLIYDEQTGIPINAEFHEYKPSTPLDMPDTKLKAIILESADSLVEWEKVVGGIGEPPVEVVAPAINNAIYNATGVRVREYPIRPERLIARLEEEGIEPIFA